jgi:DNA replicative helicase MCM subunit Mcm2 (Cdc46/Mcm family)
MKFPGLIEKDGEQQMSPEAMRMKQAMREMKQQLQQFAMENQALKMDKSLEAEKVQVESFKAKTDRLQAIMNNETDEAKIRVELEKAEMSAEAALRKSANDNETKKYINEMNKEMDLIKNSLSAGQRKNNEQVEQGEPEPTIRD